MNETQDIKTADAIRAFLTGRLHWRAVSRLTGLTRENVMNLAGVIDRRGAWG